MPTNRCFDSSEVRGRSRSIEGGGGPAADPNPDVWLGCSVPATCAHSAEQERRLCERAESRTPPVRGCVTVEHGKPSAKVRTHGSRTRYIETIESAIKLQM